MRNFTRQDSRTVTIYGVYDLEFVIEFRVSYSKYKFLHLFAINKSFIAQRLSWRNTRLVNCLFRVYFAKDEGGERWHGERLCTDRFSSINVQNRICNSKIQLSKHSCAALRSPSVVNGASGGLLSVSLHLTN